MVTRRWRGEEKRRKAERAVNWGATLEEYGRIERDEYLDGCL